MEALEQVAGQSGLRVGLAAPGLAEPGGACIRWMPGRMKGLEGLDWSAVLERPVRVWNDAQAALLAEVWAGAGRGCRDVLMLTLGTGVGGAVLSQGRLLTGRIGRGGHVGHITLNAAGERDVFQTPGSLEQAVGNLTVRERTRGRFETTLALIEAVREGEAQAMAVWDVMMRDLAAGLASLINVLDPERIIIGGGIASGAGELLFNPLSGWMDRFEWRPGGVRVPVVAAAMGEWAGVVGSVAPESLGG